MSDKQTSNHPQSNRRDFLKTTALTAGAALVGHLALAPNVHAAGSEVIKIGLVGCGRRGSGAADNALHSAANLKIVALGDVFPFQIDNCRKRLLELQEEEPIKKLGNTVELPPGRCFVGLDAHEKVLACDLDYVILATPPGFRPIHLQAAVAAGKNIFAEKPVAVDGPGVRKVLAAYGEALGKNLHIAVGTQRRHQAPYKETIKRIHDGAIGDILAVRAYWNSPGFWFRERSDLVKQGVKDSDLAYQIYNWYHFVWMSGDHIVEQHVHNLDVANWVMQDHPAKCVSSGGRAILPTGSPSEVGQIYDHFTTDFEYPNGVHMLSMCRRFNGADNRVAEAVVGTKGSCDVNKYSINGHSLGLRKGVDPYVQEHSDLIASIRSGTPLNELKNIAESTLTGIMARMSAYTGKEVTWEKALNSKLDTMPAQLSWDMSLPVSPLPIPGKTALV